jgi:hypothetical protein
LWSSLLSFMVLETLWRGPMLLKMCNIVSKRPKDLKI